MFAFYNKPSQFYTFAFITFLSIIEITKRLILVLVFHGIEPESKRTLSQI